MTDGHWKVLSLTTFEATSLWTMLTCTTLFRAVGKIVSSIT